MQVSKSERGWKRRFELSTLLETQGEWEKRMDNAPSGMFMGLMFFRHIEKQRVQRKNTKALIEAQLLALKQSEAHLDSDLEWGGTDMGVSQSQGQGQGGSQSGSRGNTHTNTHPTSPDGNSNSNTSISGLEVGEEGEKYAETCQWEVPGTWRGDPLYRAPVHDTDNPADEEAYGEFRGIPQWNIDENGNVTAVDDHENSRVLQSPGMFEITGAFQMPDEDWIPGDGPGAKEGLSGSGSPNSMITPGATLRGAKRWNSPGVVSFTPDTPGTGLGSSGSKVNSRGGGGGNSGINSMMNVGLKGEKSINLQAIAETLVANDELMVLLARRLGLPAPPNHTDNPPPGPRPQYRLPGSDSRSGSRSRSKGKSVGVKVRPSTSMAWSKDELEGDKNRGRSRSRNGDRSDNEYDNLDENWSENGDENYGKNNDDENESDGEGGAFEGIDVDDLWSDDGRNDDTDGIVAEEEMEQFLRDQYEIQNNSNGVKMPRKVADKPGSLGRQSKTVPNSVSFLDLQNIHTQGQNNGGVGGGGSTGVQTGQGEGQGEGIRGMGWRKLPRPEVSSTFYSKVR